MLFAQTENVVDLEPLKDAWSQAQPNLPYIVIGLVIVYVFRKQILAYIAGAVESFKESQKPAVKTKSKGKAKAAPDVDFSSLEVYGQPKAANVHEPEVLSINELHSTLVDAGVAPEVAAKFLLEQGQTILTRKK